MPLFWTWTVELFKVCLLLFSYWWMWWWRGWSCFYKWQSTCLSSSVKVAKRPFSGQSVNLWMLLAENTVTPDTFVNSCFMNIAFFACIFLLWDIYILFGCILNIWDVSLRLFWQLSLLLPAGGVVTLICGLVRQPCELQPLIQKL